MKIIIAFVLCVFFSLSFSANTIIESDFYYQEEDVTVIFDSESVLSAEQKQFIAEKLVLGDHPVDNGISTYAWCWLIGHEIINESVTVREHKVRTLEPRCENNIYNVETCKNCDYLEYTLISSEMFFCCPEE